MRLPCECTFSVLEKAKIALPLLRTKTRYEN